MATVSKLTSAGNHFITGEYDEYNLSNSSYATQFNGSNRYLLASGSQSTGITSDNFTVECWFNLSSLTYNPAPNPGLYIAVLYSAAGTGALNNLTSNIIWFYIAGSLNSPNSIYFGFGGTAPTGPSVTGSSLTIPLNTWHHVAVSRNGTNMAMWFNGVKVASITNASGNYAAGTSAIGVNTGSASNYNGWFTGYISNFRIVKTTPVYNPTGENITVPRSPLTAVSGTYLLTCQNQTIVDNSPNAFSISNPASATTGLSIPSWMTTKNKQYSNGTFATSSDIDEYTLPYNSYATSFNGSNQYLTVPSTAFDLSSSTSCTIEFWMYAISATGSYFYQNYTTSGSSGTGQYFAWNPSTIQFGEYNGSFAGVSQFFITSSESYSLNTWYHVAVVKNGTGTNNIKMYINGQLAATGTLANFVTPGSATTYIGARNFNGVKDYFPGYISNFRVVKGTALYTSNFTPSTSPLTSITGTSLLTLQNPTIIDNSGNAVTITNNNSVLTTNIPVNFYSAYLNGTNQYITSTGGAALSLSGDFTVEFWMYATAPRRTNAIILCRNALYTASNNMYLMFPSGSNKIALNKNGIGTVMGSVATLSNYQWYHIAFVRSGSGTNNLSLYINGVLDSSMTETSTWDWTNISISSNPSDGGLPVSTLAYAGYLSNLRIVKGTALYTSTFTPSKTALTAVTGTSLLTFQSPTIVDNSLNAFTLTNIGTATVQSPNNSFSSAKSRQSSNGTFQTYGEFDEYTLPNSMYAVQFNGSNRYLSLASNAALTFSTGDFTIEFWINVTAAPVASALIYDPRPASTQGVYTLLYLNSDRTMRFWVSSLDRITSSALTLNTWYHVALVKSSSVTTMYLNGAVTGSTYSDTNSYLASATNIAAGYAGGASITSFFSGYLSNLRVIKGTALYTANFTPSTGPLNAITNTSLLTCQSPTIIDNSINGLTITNNGAATISYVPTKFYTGYFNGTSGYLSVPYSTNLNPTSGTAMTVEFWVCLTGATAAFQFIMGMNNLTVSNWYIKNENGTILVSFGGAGGNLCAATALLNTWTHIAMVMDASNNVNIFLNGVSTITGVASSFLTNSIPLTIGARTGTPDRYFPGYISNARIVKGTALYTSNFTPPTTKLTAVTNTTLLTLNSATIVDNSGNGLAITNAGGVSVSVPIF